MANSKQQQKQADPLSREGQYSGKVYWLNVPPGYEFDLKQLREDLNGRTFQEDISDQFDDLGQISIPDVFKEEEMVVQTTSIEDVKIVNRESRTILFGDIILDDADTVSYRDEKILVLNTTRANFMIFRHDGHYYLVILAKREIAESAAALLGIDYGEFGSTINTTRIGPDAIEEVRQSLEASVKDTIIADYPEKELSSVQMKGSELEEDDTFQRQKKRGKVKNHMFQTEKLSPEDNKTVLVARDGLIRIYSNSKISTYMRLLEKHVLPNIHRDIESSPSVSAYSQAKDPEEASIYKPINESGDGE